MTIKDNGIAYETLTEWLPLVSGDEDWGIEYDGNYLGINEFSTLAYPIFYTDENDKLSFIGFVHNSLVQPWEYGAATLPYYLEVDMDNECARLWKEAE